jgi:alpha-1,4-digalacturonate transport system permease protein
MQPEKHKNTPRTNILNRSGGSIANIILDMLDWVVTPLQKRIGMNNMAYLFVLPNLLIFGVFVLFPMLLNFYYAFTGGTNFFPADRPFVGMQNFATLFDCENFLEPNSCQEDLFWRAIYNTVSFVVFQVAATVFFSLITSLVLNRNLIARGFFRSVFFYPVLLSPVVIGLIWKWILQRQGVLNAVIEWFSGDVVSITLRIVVIIFALLLLWLIYTQARDKKLSYAVMVLPGILLLLGLWLLQLEVTRTTLATIFTGEPRLFLLNPNGAKFWVIFVSTWASMGFYTLILLAGLQSIPAELYEASAIDGANAWNNFWYVTLPLLMPTMFVVLVLSLIRAVQVFDQVYVLTGGGPGTSTQYMVQYIYNTGFSNNLKIFGLSAAASVVLGGALLILTLFQLRLSSRSSLS